MKKEKMVFILILLLLMLIKFAPSVGQQQSDLKIPTVAPVKTSTQHNDVYSDKKSNEIVNGWEIPFTGFIQNMGQEENSDTYFYYSISQSHIGFEKSRILVNHNEIDEEGEIINLFSFDITFPNANEVTPKGKFRMSHEVNYFKGQSTFTGISSFEEIWYYEIYNNIDLRYFMTKEGLKYEFIVRPKGTPDEITLQVSNNLEIEIERNSVIYRKKSSSETVFTDTSLRVYQENGEVRAKFVPKMEINTYGFHIPEFDNSLDLVIDPLIIKQASYYGTSSAYDVAVDIAKDASGNIYLGGSDGGVRILKLDPSGSNIEYLSIIDGNGLDMLLGMAVDQDGHVYMSGVTRSTDFPMINAAEPNIKGTQDGWAGLLNTTGNGFKWTTYIGGNADVNDLAYDITFDGRGDAYVSGICYSPSTYDFTFVNPYSTSDHGILVKINSSNGDWIYSTSVGMSEGLNVIVDSNFNPIIIGRSLGTSLPLVDAIQSVVAGDRDTFVVKFNSGASDILFSTYFGGTGTENGYFLDFDSEENIIFGGTTSSTDLYTTSNAYQQSLAGDSDFFVAKINGTTHDLVFSTYLGGNDTESFYITGGYPISDIALDDSNNIYLTSGSYSGDYPTTTDALDTTNEDQDGILSILSANGSKLLYSTFIGSNGRDSGAGLYVNGSFTQGKLDLFMLSTVSSSDLETQQPIQDFMNDDDYYFINLRTSDEPIYVRNNADFVSEGFSGKGTQDEPYYLEGYHFIDSTKTLIHIQDTTAYFEIKECHLSAVNGSRPGIYLWNVSHGTIAYNTIHHCSDGIKLDSSCENNSLVGNTLYNNSHYAIYVDNYSNKTIIEGNIIFNQTNDGIVLGDAHENTLIGNYISYTRYGIALSNLCDSNYLAENIVAHNGYYGIYIYNSDNNTLFNNTIHDNSNSGIYLRISFNSMIFNNSIYGNGFAGIFSSDSGNTISGNEITNHSGGGDFGIYLGPSCTNNKVSNNSLYDNWYGIYLENTAYANTIFDNNLDNGYSLYLRSSAGFNLIYRNNLLSTVIDNNGTNLFHSEGLGNYWGSAYTGSDTDTDGIGDTPHTFTGNQDPFPLMYPAEWYTIHNILNPTVVYPNGGETLSGVVTIQWEAATDSWGHAVTYSVYYSTDAGNTWVQLVSGYSSTSYTWNTTVLPDHSNYMAKVVATCSENLTAYDISDTTFTIQKLSVDIISPTSTTYSQMSITLNYTVSKGTVTIFINNVANISAIPSGASSPFPDGNYNITIMVEDHMGNFATATVIFDVDTTPPIVSIDSPTSTTYTTGSIMVLLSGDAAHYWYTIEGIDIMNQTWDAAITRSLPDGLYTLHAFGNDSVGNEVYISVTFIVEIPPTTTPPVTTTPITTTPLTTTEPITTTLTTTKPTTLTTTTSKPTATTSTATEEPPSVTSFPSWMSLILLLSIITIILRRRSLKRGF
ncbi:MAG: right-handed parallel beta-helix repeat-containing protein [Candidatus Heimdallarchaeota archaeon]|nr:MAG: right-handed parallel beta-helix repeat-containing protein [Candidatus Heimdallarchaeota archaeon]